MSAWTKEREDFARKSFPPPRPHRLESMRGPGSSNWILKGFALAGPHPGNTAAEAVANLTPLLRAGVTCFVSLQPELPKPGHEPMRRSAFNGGVILTARDFLPDAQAIVDAGGLPQSGGPKLSLLHLPIPESPGVVAGDDALKAFALSLVAHMRAGELLYIHCADGNGRTGTLAALLLGLAHGISSSEALDMAQRARADRPGAGGSCPETHEQKMQVHRLLGDAAFRAAAASVAPRPANSIAADESARLAATLAKIRVVLARRGACSLVYLRRYVGTHVLKSGGGSSSSGVIDRSTFDRVCADAEWFLTPDEITTLWAATQAASERELGPGAAEHSGVAAAEALWRLVRGRLSERRTAAVHDLFRRLSGGTGFVSMTRLASSFSPTAHPDVTAGRRTVEAVTAEFLDTFSVGGGGASGSGASERPARSIDGSAVQVQVSASDWEAYYASLSPAIPDDALFELWLYGSWLPAGATLHIPSHGDGAGGGFGAAGGAGAFEDDGRAGVSRMAALRAGRKDGIAPKVTTLSHGAAPLGDELTAATLTRAYVEEMKEVSAEASGAAGAGASAGTAAAAAAAAAATAVPMSTTEHGYTYVDLEDLSKVRIAVRSLLRRSGCGGNTASLTGGTPLGSTSNAGAGAFALAALAGTLRRQDGLREGLVSCRDLQSAFGDVGVPLPDADAALVFRTLASHIYNMPPGAVDAASMKVPLEDALATLREPLEGARLDAVSSIFQGFDRRGTGSVPAALLVAAFNAEGYPPVMTGRVPPRHVYKAFQDGFADAFSMVDRHGPDAKRRAVGSGQGASHPAFRAYAAYGTGDGQVRFAFFRAFNEALSTLIRDQSEFLLVVHSIWSGGASRRPGTAVAVAASASSSVSAASGPLGVQAHALAAKTEAASSGDGMLTSMARMSHGFGATASSAAAHMGMPPGSTGGPGTPGAPRTFGRRGDPELGTSAPRPPTFAGAGSAGAGSEYDTAPGSARRSGRQSPGGHSTFGRGVAGMAGLGDAAGGLAGSGRYGGSAGGAGTIYGGGDGMTGGVGSAMRREPVYTLGHGAAQEHTASPHIPASCGDRDADAALAAARLTLLRRGPRGLARLHTEIEDALHDSGRHALETGCLPFATFSLIAGDLGASEGGVRAVARACGAGVGPDGAPAVDVERFLLSLRGELGPARMETVRSAFSHLLATQAAATSAGSSGSAGGPGLLLETVHFGFKSAHHPDVLSGRRSEDDVLTEFMETSAAYSPDGRSMPWGAWARMYTDLSFFFASDAAFQKVLFDSWALGAATRGRGGAAGKPTGGVDRDPAPAGESPFHTRSGYGNGPSRVGAGLGDARSTFAVEPPRQELPPPGYFGRARGPESYSVAGYAAYVAGR